jgi:uroporphyrin-III C-methyltransferase
LRFFQNPAIFLHIPSKKSIHKIYSSAPPAVSRGASVLVRCQGLTVCPNRHRKKSRWLMPAAGLNPTQALAMKGKVYLMGAGPGDTDLLTVKAVRVLRAAEVVLHDDLVSPQILDLVPASAQVRNVRKLGLQTENLREKIHSLLISAAREGHQVVRLKASEVLPSAHADDETEALAQAGVDFEVIPGAASAMGAAAGANSN